MMTTRSHERRTPCAWLCLAWLAASGCSIPGLLEKNANGIGLASQAMRDTTRSIEVTSQSLRALEPSLAQAAALGPELQQLSALRADLAEIALLRKELAQIANLSSSLARVSELDGRLAQVAALSPTLERVIAMREPLEQLSRVAAETKELGRLEQPLVAAAGLDPSLRGLERSVRALSELTGPLDRTSTSLSRLLALLEHSPWLLGLGFLIWLVGTCAAAGLGAYFGWKALGAGRKLEPHNLD